MKSVSIVVPSYNDEKHIEMTIKKINGIAAKLFDDYEVLIFDDGSEDKTGEIVDRLAKKNSKIKVFHNTKNMNVGYNFRMGIKHAAKKYVMLLPGPDSMLVDSIRYFMTKIGDADIVVAYTANKEARPYYRRIVSYLATTALNLLFGLRMKYLFGMQAYETSLVRKVKVTTNSFGILPEIIIRLVKRGHSYKELPLYARDYAHDSTTAFRIKNIAGVITVIIRLFFDIHFSKNVEVKARKRLFW